MGEIVSIVVPAYNEAARFASSLPRLRAALEHDGGIELIVVDDGSTDDTAAVVTKLLSGWSSARLVRLPWNGGKGAAVKAGVAVARGEITVFMDADLSADIADLPKLIHALHGADIALGSRAIAGSSATYETSFRRVTSKVFNSVVCLVAGVTASDTQCGFKAFRTPVAKLLFHLTEVDGFAFDVEVLALAELLGYRVTEVPVRWTEAEGTKVHPVRDPVRMLRDVVRTRRRCDERALRLDRSETDVAATDFHVTDITAERHREAPLRPHLAAPARNGTARSPEPVLDTVIDLTDRAVAERELAVRLLAGQPGGEAAFDAATGERDPRKPLAGVAHVTAPARLRPHHGDIRGADNRGPEARSG